MIKSNPVAHLFFWVVQLFTYNHNLSFQQSKTGQLHVFFSKNDYCLVISWNREEHCWITLINTTFLPLQAAKLLPCDVDWNPNYFPSHTLNEIIKLDFVTHQYSLTLLKANIKSMSEMKVKSITSNIFPLFRFTLWTPQRLSTTAHGGLHNVLHSQ